METTTTTTLDDNHFSQLVTPIQNRLERSWSWGKDYTVADGNCFRACVWASDEQQKLNWLTGEQVQQSHYVHQFSTEREHFHKTRDIVQGDNAKAAAGTWLGRASAERRRRRWTDTKTTYKSKVYKWKAVHMWNTPNMCRQIVVRRMRLTPIVACPTAQRQQQHRYMQSHLSVMKPPLKTVDLANSVASSFAGHFLSLCLPAFSAFSSLAHINYCNFHSITRMQMPSRAEKREKVLLCWGCPNLRKVECS